MVGVLDSGDSDWWDTYQSIDDEIRALCVHEDFNHTVSTRYLHDVYEDFARPNVSLSSVEIYHKLVSCTFHTDILQ